MSRTAEFDRATAIRAVRDVFWRDGYAETALPTLEKATGLNRSSIYNSFGSKRGLFDAAVDNYLDEIVRPRLRPLFADVVAANALNEYLAGLSTAFESLDPAPGCLLVNASGSSLVHDAEVSRVIADYLEELRGAVARGVNAALPELEPLEAQRRVDAVAGLIISAFTLVPLNPESAIQALDTARALIDPNR